MDNFDINKAYQVIIYLKKKLKDINKSKMVKLLFLADEYHINNYRRLICGGQYVAMNNGHVNSEFYDVIKSDQNIIHNKDIHYKINNIDIAEDIDILSKSDIEALDYAIDKYGKKDISELVEISHSKESWSKNHKNNTSTYINTTELIEDENLRKYYSAMQKEKDAFINWLTN